jgi:sarcosine oxidase
MGEDMNRKKFLQLASAGIGGSVLSGIITHSKTHLKSATSINRSPDVVVVGAGAFGGWTALHLAKKGANVTLLDAYGPGNSRSSSGGETRQIQVDAGERTIYIRMAIRAYELWRDLEERAGTEVFLPTGRLAMYQSDELLDENRWKVQQLEEKFNITDAEILDRDEIRYRWPQIYSDDLEFALYNPGGVGGGVLRSREACRVVVKEFEKAGGTFHIARAEPEFSGAGRLNGLKLSGGETLRADRYLFACGPWLPELFPDLLGDRLDVQRRDVLFYGVPSGDPRYSYPQMPNWSLRGSGWYGFPDIDYRGIKAAPYPDLNSIDPDSDERMVMPQQVKRGHDFIRERFPGLAGQPVTETRVCQVTNTENRHFIVDQHPSIENVWIAGGGSGHGYKHGPAVGEFTAQRMLGEEVNVDFYETFKLE